MAVDKNSFILYCDLIHTVEQMPDDKAGLLFKHILRYVNDKNPVTDDLIIQLTFEPVKQQLKRDLKAWEIERMQRSDAGKKGMEKRWNKQKPENQTITPITNDNTVITEHNTVIKPITKITDTVTVTDTVNVIVKDSLKEKQVFLVSDFISKFNEVRNTKFRSLSERDKKVLLESLKIFTIDEIIRAYRNALTDPFHIEKGFKHLTPEFFTRQNKIETFLNYSGQKFAPKNAQDRAFMAYANSCKELEAEKNNNQKLLSDDKN